MKLRYTPRALKDLAEIADYIRVHNPAAAKLVRTAIRQSVSTLRFFLYIGHRQTTEGVRRIVTQRYPYLVYYAVIEASKGIPSVKDPAQEREYDDA